MDSQAKVALKVKPKRHGDLKANTVVREARRVYMDKTVKSDKQTPIDEDWEQWDREFEKDAKAGRLDFLKAEVEQAKREGTLKEL